MRFLSEEWAQAVTDGLNQSDEFKTSAAKTSTTMQQIVTEAPEGELRYWLTIDAGVATMGTGDAPDAEVTITQSYETAVGIAKGEISAVTAYMSGKLQVSNVMKAMGLQAPLQALAPIIRDIDCEY